MECGVVRSVEGSLETSTAFVGTCPLSLVGALFGRLAPVNPFGEAQWLADKGDVPIGLLVA